ncbi:proline--tRNA ligase [Deinococcus humi]|uniref:Proline--tRNA ligase n=1 Tax=Deinococcus humi TaxID=662880 RepID=A0A7W8K0Z4_9DEIO|nr:proline--tRNA ligase [Deinococcus humi]MBB5365583.1 prolyl-tRNA synthetase [Deinococcus humi]GGO36497.1 proline--tRNA ligase [Deinococcus humi]
MRLSKGTLVTRRETPSEADTRGTEMLLRAGFIRQLGSGLYTTLPLMTRVLHKLEALIRRELDGAAQEVSFPQLQPAALWRQSGRWDAYTQVEQIMFAVTDRGGRELALAPTHEEVAVAVARELVGSYRDLPLSVYQIGRKFRDELRPRAGLLRTREFVMKDGYSFHATPEDLARTFEVMGDAYARILTRLGAEWRAAQADSGLIGGAESREYLLLSDVGEDTLLYTADGLYVANAERAVSRAHPAPASPFSCFERRHTPGTSTVASACAALGCEASQMIKNVLYEAEFLEGGQPSTRPVLVSLRGDHSVNPVKLWNAVSARIDGTLTALEVADTEQWAGDLPLGYLAPDLPDGTERPFLRLCDGAAAHAQHFATGANETGFHVVGANWGQQYPLPEVADLRQVEAGERSIHDPAQPLLAARGIEVGHIFQLGTRYTAAMNLSYTAADGTPQTPTMGCYGLGVTRLAAALAEQLADERGLVWPAVIAPYEVILTVVDLQDTAQVEAAEGLYAELRAAGVDALLDDRPSRAGVKFADADLTGIPWRVTLGRTVGLGRAEVRERRGGETWEPGLGKITGFLRARLGQR